MNNNISNFMTWWINQFISIFTTCLNTLNSISFAGTTLLKFIIGITIIGLFLPVIIKLPRGIGKVTERIPKGEKK